MIYGSEQFASAAHTASTETIDTPADQLRSVAKDRDLLPIVQAADQRDLNTWFSQNRETIDAVLKNVGGLFLRGFDLPDRAAFSAFARTQIKDLLPYTERSTPRREVADRIYTSTEYPADQQIAFHNEFSYALQWPRYIAFYCERPALEGGETPVAACRKVYDRIAPAVRERFERLSVQYVRRYGWGIDLSWQEAYETDDRAIVEKHCRANAIDAEWCPDNKLITRQVRPAVTVHPDTGDKLWFNQAHLFHVSNLPQETRVALERILGDNLPREALFGDGSPIDDKDLDNVRAAYQEASVAIPWQQGDVLFLDNMLFAHGRQPFNGDRRVFVALGQPFPNTAA